MCITNTHALFHLLCNEELRKYQNFSKRYDHDCLQNFLLLFLGLLTVPIVKKNNTLTGIYFIFLKNAMYQT